MDAYSPVDELEIYCKRCKGGYNRCRFRQCKRPGFKSFFDEKNQKYSIYICKYHFKIVFENKYPPKTLGPKSSDILEVPD
jgi:hypothetical protein